MKAQTESVAGNELFLKNMCALWRQDPQLALQVDAVNDEDRIPLEPARSGAWTVRMKAADGTHVYLHSRHDPQAEAERFAASVAIEETYCFVVSGMGLGYHLRALFERFPHEAVLVCTEPSVPLIATALTCVDLTELIASRRLIVLTEENRGRLHDQLGPIGTLMMLGARFVQHPPSMRIAEKAQAELTKTVTEFVSYQRMSLMTLVANSRTTCRNIAMNLPHYVSTPPLDVLRNRFSGNPAIVIAAGPSLSRNIGQLAGLKGRAVFCAVQTALKPLLQRGIVPDFATTLDFHEISRNFFEGLDGLDDVHLVAEPKVAWQVLDYYAGPMSLLGNSWAQLLLGDELGAREGLRSGATVAHLAFYLAEYMGCDPIIFVGQDLAFTGHVFYVPGVEIHQTWRAETNRFCTMEQKEWERIARNRPILRRVRANPNRAAGFSPREPLKQENVSKKNDSLSSEAHGSQKEADLYTDELLFTYLEQFEKDIARTPAKIINATEGGAHIRGTEVMTLREAAERYCAQTIDPHRFDYRGQVRWKDPSRLEPARQALTRRIEELDEAGRVCDELLELLKELDGLTDDALRFNQRLIRVDELRTRIAQESRAYQIINAATQLAELRRYSADRRIEASELDHAARAKRQIARDVEFISAVRDGIRDVKPILSDALNRLAEPQTAASDPAALS